MHYTFHLSGRRGLIAACSAALLAGCGGGSGSESLAELQAKAAPTTLVQYPDWPHINSDIPSDAATEAHIQAIVAGMSLAEKVGQMTQPEIKSITPAQVTQYYIGSVLNGGGSWPQNNKHALSSDWVKLADDYWMASMATDAKVKIPVIWGTDAVHGHGNVYGATLFPHNIGLGAANDPALVRRIGQAVAVQVASTGIDWSFAPTLAVVRDDRWGRTYEGYSEDPLIVSKYGYEMIKGLQGDFARPATVIATAKHFMGDGGTDQGKDQGVNMSTKAEMVNIHGQGYYSALGAGAQTVMASFNSWTNEAAGITVGKMHGSKEMLTDVLKTKIGFDGFVIGDWNGHGQVPGCSDASCAQAINAGVDMIMVPDQWKAFIANTITQVQNGAIPLARIDDAVTRILRVKMRAGVFTAKRPLERLNAGDAAQLQHRVLAREAVRKSLVLLKNDKQLLPLVRGQKVLVVGKSADNLSNQTGGWSLTWQGTSNTNADFPNADSILAGIKAATGAANVVYSETGTDVNISDFKTVIAVIGETPYAEGVGDIGKTGTLEHARRYPEDLAVLNAVSGKGVPVVTVLVTGRPVLVNKEINRSDAFVVAWLPGTEGKGVGDVLYRTYNGKVNFDTVGKLSFSWPKAGCQTPLNVGDAAYDPLFAYGYGMRYADQKMLAKLDESVPTLGCGQTAGGGGTATVDLEIFNSTDKAPFALGIGSPENWGGTAIGSDLNAVVSHATIKVETTQVNVQQDAKKVSWTGTGQFYSQAPSTSDQQSYLNADGALVFDTIVHKLPDGLVKLRIDCSYPCIGEVDGTTLFSTLGLDAKRTVKIPLACFAAKGTDFSAINTPILVYTEKAFTASFANIRWVPGAAKDADAVACDSLVPPTAALPTPKPGPSYSVFSNGLVSDGFKINTYSTNNVHTSYSVLPSGELALNFAADGGDGLLFFNDSAPINLVNFASGKLEFELNVSSYGSNSGGLVVKLESAGTNCTTGDVLFGRPAAGGWQTVSLPVGTLTAAKTACFDLRRTSVPFAIFPKWGDQQGVQFQVRNVRFTQ
ncbi:beta-glucosidase [Rhodoferax ferrireducens]|uniref:Beta-glucosidase n=1 Tax=Rhodoferax ferrireducens TaxID=192843 RepID=A0ABU2CEW9_9BURK|nr:glycoside hydrolase family 3 N-terminal domain-containing protein [Rhodoferax ferrireducens]MDR7379742.1 beta-glucosidase [Rhodoferax ferrireducens]